MLPTRFFTTIVLCLAAVLLTGCGKNETKSNLELAAKSVNAHDKISAAKYVEQAVASDPQNPEVLHQVLMIYTRPGFHSEQVHAARNLVEILDKNSGITLSDRDKFDMYSTTAMLMDKGDEDVLAEHCYLEAVRLEPDDPMPSNNLAYFYADHRKNLVQAEKLARYAVSVRPGEPYIEDTMGWVLFQTGQLPEAEVHLRKGVEGMSDNPDLRYHLATVYAAQGKNEQAKIELYKCLKLSPNHRDSQILLNKITTKHTTTTK